MTKYKIKERFIERMKEMLGPEIDAFLAFIEQPLPKAIRANTLKISTYELKRELEKKYGWKIEQPLASYQEAFIIKSRLEPGELGKTIEHQEGYYFVQGLASMMSVLALKPEPEQTVLDMCAAPGGKTTQLAALMKNKGKILANDIAPSRVKILKFNLERCGVENCTVTNLSGRLLAKKFPESFDKILVDAPCSGEGTMLWDFKARKVWSLDLIKRRASLQKKLLGAAIACLKSERELVYSTCTFAPEENEAVIDWAIKKFPVKLEEIKLPQPFKIRAGITEWHGKTFDKEVAKAARIYPQDNSTEGFFIAKLKKSHD